MRRLSPRTLPCRRQRRPGLTLETGTIAELLEVAMDIVPELLASNLGFPNRN